MYVSKTLSPRIAAVVEWRRGMGQHESNASDTTPSYLQGIFNGSENGLNHGNFLL
jgi:hypothetical protein